MNRRVGSKLILTIAAAAAGALNPIRSEWDWPTSFTKGSAPELVALHSEIHRTRLAAGAQGYAVERAKFRAAGFEVRLAAGTLWLEEPLSGYPAGAWFEGEAYVSFEPGSRAAEDGPVTDACQGHGDDHRPARRREVAAHDPDAHFGRSLIRPS